MRSRVIAGVIILMLPVMLGAEYRTNLRLAQAPAMYREPDPITSMHESTHWLNSQLRQRHGGSGFYLGSGRFLWTRQKPVSPTLGQIASQVRYRGRTYSLYCVQSRFPLTPQPSQWGLMEGHERNPLFLFDELSAYTLAAAVAVRYRGRGYSDRLEAALELAHYSATCLRMFPPHVQAELRPIWLRLARLLEATCLTARATGRQYSAKQNSWFAELQREISRQSNAR